MDANVAAVAIAGLVLAGQVTTLVFQYKNKAVILDKVSEVHQETRKVIDATNGMKDQLVAVNRNDATQIERARGAAEQREIINTTRSDATQVERARGIEETSARNEAAKEQRVERRRQPMMPLVAVPVAAELTTAETLYAIRGGKLVEVDKP